MSQKKSESKLLAGIRSGDSESIRVWFDQHHDDLLRFVSSKISSPKDAEEIVQETFINCLKHVQLFEEKSSIKTWMISIARHEIADFYRKKYAKKAIETIPLHDIILGKHDKVHNAEQVAAAVRKTLETIRSDYSELLMMKYVDNLSVKNIARKLDKTIKSVESDLFRARTDFKEVYVAQVS